MVLLVHLRLLSAHFSLFLVSMLQVEPTGEAPTPIESRSNYDLNFISVREDEFADPVMPGGVASGGASASCQRTVQNNR